MIETDAVPHLMRRHTPPIDLICSWGPRPSIPMHCAIKAHVTFRDLITDKKEHRLGQQSRWEEAKVNLVDAVRYGKDPIRQACLARKGEAEMVVIPRGRAIFRPLYGLAGHPVRTDHPIVTHGIGH